MNTGVSMLLLLSLVVGCGKTAGDNQGNPADAGMTAADANGTADAASAGDAASTNSGIDASDMRAEDMPSTDVAFNEAMFAATHNSYSGGARGTIEQQLERGVRFIEFDVHADDFLTSGYRIGHDSPGHEVAVGGGNPEGIAWVDWLTVVQDWRVAHPNHLPLTIGIDVKDDLLALPTVGDGNLGALNRLVSETFGDALFARADVGAAWPTVDEMRGRVLVVLSGDSDTRLGYRRTEGINPAVASADGAVVLAHESGGDVVVWSGSDGELAQYERIADHGEPAVATDGSDVVLFALAGESLRVRTGTLQVDRSIVWDGGLDAFVDGAPARNPSVRFIDASTVREVHETPAGQTITWDGAWDSAARTFTWSLVEPSQPRFDEASDGASTVWTADTPPYGNVVHFDAGTPARVRLPQRMFSESQRSGPVEFENDDVVFFAADAFDPQDVAWAEEKRRAGAIVRLWKFNLPNVRPEAAPTFPATDRPDDAWYLEYCRNCLRD